MNEMKAEHKKLIVILIGAVAITAIVMGAVFYMYSHKKTTPVPTPEGQVVTEVPIVQKVETFSSQAAFDKAHPELKGILLLATSTTKTQ